MVVVTGDNGAIEVDSTVDTSESSRVWFALGKNCADRVSEGGPRQQSMLWTRGRSPLFS